MASAMSLSPPVIGLTLVIAIAVFNLLDCFGNRVGRGLDALTPGLGPAAGSFAHRVGFSVSDRGVFSRGANTTLAGLRLKTEELGEEALELWHNKRYG